MQWEKEAEAIVDNMAIPPVMAGLARLDAERRAMQKGQAAVTAAIAKATEKGYARVFGPEATEVVRRMGRGEDVGLPDAFFEDDDGELFKIELCPAKYGACTADKRNLMLAVLLPLRAKLRELNTTGIILGKARTPLMSHHVLRVAIIGCPNCCMTPYFTDFGIICQLRPAVTPEGCTQCQACVRYCTEGAITLEHGRPVIDYERCIMCGGCEKECKKAVIAIKDAGYKVVIGGTGSRHPRIAQTLAGWTDATGVVALLEKFINAYRHYPSEKNELSFHELVSLLGVEALRCPAAEAASAVQPEKVRAFK